MTERKIYRRESEDKRRLALIEATLALVAEGGAGAATVRAIAERAGVTPGLIRHYFQSKDQLVIAAYRHLMDRMTEDSASVLRAAPVAPEGRLAVFVAASLTPPVVDPEALTLWATFLQETPRDPVMHETHAQTYLTYRNRLQELIAALPGDWPPARSRAMAIACNAVIDGLWVEGSALPEAFAPGELAELGIRSVGAILGIDLSPWLLITAPTLMKA
jgi:AcrR family transcriptional regulator